jgi:glycosyltransferase involved in cell wall biosynthesis
VPKRRILYVSSNHGAIRPGGLESYTQELYEAFRRSEEFEPLYIARAGEPYTERTCHHGWSPFAMVGGDPNQYLFYTDTFAEVLKYDIVFRRWAEKPVLTRYFRDFLLAQKPDVVHFHHTNFLGYDILRVTRNALPDVPILFTLHEYLSICHHDGQMVRTRTMDLCQEESPRRCHECFPSITAQTFAMRKRFIQSHLSLVDCFVAPSAYIRDLYVDWGLPARKVVVEPQAMAPVTDRLPDEAEDRSRNRFAYFGQLNRYKGADVLLGAMELLGDDFDGHLRIFGANLEIQPKEFREDVEARAKGGTITFAGPYEHSDLGKLMAAIDWVVVPSIWWETGPMVVMEAFQYGKPVICSDIGGMSEKVTDGTNGLHFRRRDRDDLAAVMRRAARTPGLWAELRAGIPSEPLRTMDDHVAVLSRLYRELLTDRTGANLHALPSEELTSA